MDKNEIREKNRLLKLISATERRGEWQKKTDNIIFCTYKQYEYMCVFYCGIKNASALMTMRNKNVE